VSNRSRVAAVVRHMRDPYTPGSMFPSAAAHADVCADSPDGGDIR